MAGRSKERVDKGVSLARFPALVLGSLLLAFGLLELLKDNKHSSGGFPDGTANGVNLFGFEGNGWTGLITAVAGGLLMFGAAQHLLAKTMSLIVGLALGACSVIALVDGDDVLGLAAANGWTKLGWGAASAFLLINTLLPRKGGHKPDDDRDLDRDRVVERPAAPRREPVAAERVQATPVTTDRVRTERVTEEPTRTARVSDESVRTERVSVDRRDDEDEVRTDPGMRDRRLDEPGLGRGDGSVGDETLRDDPRGPSRDSGSVADDRLRDDERPR